MKILNKKAFSVIEYAVLFIIIIGAFLLMRDRIQRAIFGNWGQAGQSFAFGRQYDPQKTIECSFDEQLNLWYDRNCAESKNCDIGTVTITSGGPTGGGPTGGNPTGGNTGKNSMIICEKECAGSSCAQLNK